MLTWSTKRMLTWSTKCMLTWSTKWKTMVAVSISTESHYNSYRWELSAVLFIFRKWCSCSIGLCFLGMPNSLNSSMFLYYSVTAQSLVSDACVHHILCVSYGTHQSCTICTEAPSVWIFHFHTVFIMKRLLKCRQILIWKAAASSRHMHLTESQTHKEQLCCWRDRLHHSPTTRQAHAHSHKEQLWCWRDRLHHSPTTSRLLGGYEAGSVFTTSAATKSSKFSVSSFSSATPTHQHSANTNKQHPNAERLKQTLI